LIRRGSLKKGSRGFSGMSACCFFFVFFMNLCHQKASILIQLNLSFCSCTASGLWFVQKVDFPHSVTKNIADVLFCCCSTSDSSPHMEFFYISDRVEINSDCHPVSLNSLAFPFLHDIKRHFCYILNPWYRYLDLSLDSLFYFIDPSVHSSQLLWHWCWGTF
jgi:hypothetical protein